MERETHDCAIRDTCTLDKECPHVMNCAKVEAREAAETMPVGVFEMLANVEVKEQECDGECDGECECGPAAMTPMSGFDLYLASRYASERSEEGGT